MHYPGNRRAAISFTFDDGSRDHLDVAIPLLETFGFRATFFVIAGLTRDRKTDPPLAGRERDWWAEVAWEEWREAARRGHEIGNHSMTHPALTRVRDARQLQSEIADSARLIEEKIGRRPACFAFPYNKQSSRLRGLARQHHESVRDDRVRYGGRRFTVEKANRLVDRAIQKGAWLVPMIHGIGGGFDPLDPGVFRRHLEWIRGRESEVWVAPFGEVSRWIRSASP